MPLDELYSILEDLEMFDTIPEDINEFDDDDYGLLAEEERALLDVYSEPNTPESRPEFPSEYPSTRSHDYIPTNQNINTLTQSQSNITEMNNNEQESQTTSSIAESLNQTLQHEQCTNDAKEQHLLTTLFTCVKEMDFKRLVTLFTAHLCQTLRVEVHDWIPHLVQLFKDRFVIENPFFNPKR